MPNAQGDRRIHVDGGGEGKKKRGGQAMSLPTAQV